MGCEQCKGLGPSINDDAELVTGLLSNAVVTHERESGNKARGTLLTPGAGTYRVQASTNTRKANDGTWMRTQRLHTDLTGALPTNLAGVSRISGPTPATWWNDLPRGDVGVRILPEYRRENSGKGQW